mmetsp:Transcript_31951/g.85571  ORF Transcript_31951/g.85571 Transcript_31951/m.85571 type:complete len:217 (+) Transcript_31951:960-1610(+)
MRRVQDLEEYDCDSIVDCRLPEDDRIQKWLLDLHVQLTVRAQRSHGIHSRDQGAKDSTVAQREVVTECRASIKAHQRDRSSAHHSPEQCKDQYEVKLPNEVKPGKGPSTVEKNDGKQKHIEQHGTDHGDTLSIQSSLMNHGFRRETQQQRYEHNDGALRDGLGSRELPQKAGGNNAQQEYGHARKHEMYGNVVDVLNFDIRSRGVRRQIIIGQPPR